ncbi:peptidoglycan recognition protein [Anabrus simplex]|uniref:peptidoglycan recognition protein n=1 Tax=Anabrus simplex TaxID=316456 RepID=UPI0035A3814C
MRLKGEMLMVAAVVTVLLVIGGVEVNPGPQNSGNMNWEDVEVIRKVVKEVVEELCPFEQLKRMIQEHVKEHARTRRWIEENTNEVKGKMESSERERLLPVGSYENLIYETPVESEEDLLARDMAAAHVGGPGIDDRVYENMIHAADCPRIVSRAGWGAKRPWIVEYMVIPVEYVVIAHTVTQPCNSASTCADIMVNIQTHHMNLSWGDIGYSFVVGGDGNVYEGRGWHKVGAHTKGFNKKGLGIALIGEFSDEIPSRIQLDALKNLLKCGVELGELSEDFKLLGHRQLIATKSPGLALYQEIQTWPEWVEEL